jgi:hypothetical protein
MAYGYQQQGPWQGGGGYHQPQQPSGSPGLSVMAGILGIALAGCLGYATIDMLGDIPDGADLPGGYTALFVLHFLVAGLGLLGAILVFARQVAGAFVLLGTGLLAVVAIVVDPLMADGLFFFLLDPTEPPSFAATGEFAAYWEAMLEFGDVRAILFAASLVLGVIVLIIAALPPSLNYLRGSSRGPAGYGYPQQSHW